MVKRKPSPAAPSEKTCRQMTDLVLDYLTNKLSPRVKREFEQHLGICPDCVNFLQTYKKTVAVTNSVKPTDIPANVRDNIFVQKLGAGWMREEFEALGQDYTNRGRRLDEMVDVLRTLWHRGPVEHHGRFYDFDRLEMSPAPTEPIPIWGGGQSDAALARAARLDGWIGNAYPLEEALQWVARLHALRAANPANPTYETIVGITDRPSLDTYREAEDAGVSGLLCAPWMTGTDPATRRAALERFAERIVQRL